MQQVRLSFLLFLLGMACLARGQSVLTVRVTDEETGTPVEGASVVVINSGAALTDSLGAARIDSVPPGEQSIIASYLGYYRKKIKLVFPLASTAPVEVALQQQENEMEEVIIISTRNEKKIDDLPTHVEVVAQSEVEERSSDKPSDVSHIVKEQPGIQVQRTSATAGTMNVRLQGLKGRYVQVLKDGFPLFGGFANVIGITQIPPLDIKQVEIIKGPSSTLYGGDAIAGVVNLISKEPGEKPVYDIMLNGESARAGDAGVYASQKIKWFAFALTGIYRYQYQKDWNGDNFTETPYLQRYSVSPQLFFDMGTHARLNIGALYTHEYRVGGALPYIEGRQDSVYGYYEKNTSDHLATNLKFQYDFGSRSKLTVKNSVNYFKRNLHLPFYLFKGEQLGSASEINYHFATARHDLVVGLDFRTDRFNEGRDSSLRAGNYNFLTGGFFAQYGYSPNAKATVEGGLRIDYNNLYKVYALPHVAVKYKWNEVFTTRVNAGMGYKLPTIFQDESEEARFIGILPISDSVKPELSLGGTLDLRVKLPDYNGLSITISQLYFITHLFRPMRAVPDSMENCPAGNCTGLSYISARGFQQTYGVENSLHIAYGGLNIGLVYSLTDNNFNINNVKSIAPLTSKHIVSILLDYEIKNFRAGIDCYYYSPVKLTNGNIGHSIWEFGIVAQYAHKYFLLFANLENVLNIKQTNFGPIVFADPSYNNPRFSEIYAPLEGRLFNAGIKIHLGAFSKKYKTDTGHTERLGARPDND